MRRKKKVHEISAPSDAHGRGCVIEKLDSYAVDLRNESFAEKQLDFADATTLCFAHRLWFS